MEESQQERDARLAKTAMAAFVAIENSKTLVAEGARRLADLRSQQVERRLLAESQRFERQLLAESQAFRPQTD